MPPPCRGGSARGRSGRRGRASPCARARLRRRPRGTARAPAGVERKTSSGRSRLPPAASASLPTAATRPGWLATVRASRSSSASRYSSSPSAARIVGERRAHRCASPTCSATMPPAKRRYRTLAETVTLEQPGELLRRPGSGARSRGGTCTPRRRAGPCRAAAQRGRTRRDRRARAGRAGS